MSAPEAPIRVALADDQALVRAGFRLLLDAEDGFEVVGEAADGAQAVDVARASLPDVVLMDVRMPGVDGIEATRRIVAAGVTPAGGSAEDFERFFRGQFDGWAAALVPLNLKVK